MKEVVASLKYTKGSVYKIALVADLVRGLSVKEAGLQLAFCGSRSGVVLGKLLNSAVANAKHNFGLNSESLIVKNVEVGKAFVLKRGMPRGRGRSNRIEKKFSNIKIVLTSEVKSSVKKGK